MTVSIVLPVRNALDTLPLALSSIRQQVFHSWELVIVNDGSSDQTRHFLESIAQADKRIRILSQPHLGIAEALRRGCASARGEFIARMDADDWMHPERLLQQIEFLEAHPKIGVVSCLVRHGGDVNAQAGYAMHVEWINSLITPEDIALRRFVESPVAHPSVMFRHELLGLHGGYASGDFPEDYELWLRWMDAGVPFAKVPSELLTWNDPPARLSRVDQRYRPEAFYCIKCLYLAKWLKRFVAPSREIWVWGAGRVTRRRFQTLQTMGITIAGHIDVDPKKLGRRRDGLRVTGHLDLPAANRSFIVAGVSSRGAREFISAHLRATGRAEGSDFLLAA